MLVQQTIHYSELQHSRSQIRSQAQQQPQQAPQTEQTPAPQENGPTQDASTPDSHDGQDGAQQSNQLDLNTADLGELQTLKGVGPVTAQRILDYRTQIGRFGGPGGAGAETGDCCRPQYAVGRPVWPRTPASHIACRMTACSALCRPFSPA